MQRALQLHQAGRLAEAEAGYRAVLAAQPDNVDALHLLGVLALQSGRAAEAEDLILRALARNPRNAAALNNLGLVFAAQAKPERALASFRDALALQPDYVDALINLGAAWLRQAQAAQAEACLARAVSLAPDNAAAQSGLGNLRRLQGRLGEALACHQRAIALQPQAAEAHVNLANVFRDLGRLQEAIASYRAALALQPALPEASANLGNALLDAGDAQAAIVCLRRALELRPGFAEAHAGLANALLSAGRLADAEGCLRRALELQPGFAAARLSLAHVRLLQGDYESGLPLYESRFDMGAGPAQYAGLGVRQALVAGIPRWRGEHAGGRSLVVWTEQGLGDSLMVMRYLPLIKQRGVGRLVVYCDAELVRVMQGAAGVDEVVPRTRQTVSGLADLQCPSMSLPLAFGTRVASIPGQVPYLAVPEPLGAAWAQRLSGTRGPRVGLAWAGAGANPKDTLRSLQLREFEPVFGVPGVSFVSLQKGGPAQELGQPHREVLDWMGECDDLLQTAALVQQLDLVISVDTAVAHLAGALGKPVWLLNRFESEWRWLLEREDSPWYPTMRVFRQPRAGDWAPVLARVATALHALAMQARHG
jgi:tetratricopeptide (TPR) repeat protein